ncbi:MAG: bifunctional aspartate kinase/homoserine dehydrogenase I [Spirochaetaceae bacterium]|nr:bifunctional aspartate kinase/homoserine dehydrogenase I [Spirochaetaceae bacterium]
MKNSQIHSVEGEMLFKDEGCSNLLQLVKSAPSSIVIVFSSDKEKFLDTKSLFEAARTHNEKVWIELENREEAINSLISSKLQGPKKEDLLKLIRTGFTNIEDILKAVWLVSDISSGAMGFFDYLVSTWIVNFAKDFLKLNKIEAKIINYNEASKLNSISDNTVFLVHAPMYKSVTCFDSQIAAANIAVNIKSPNLVFWNSKSLLNTADVNEVPSATVIPSLSFNEATELSYFGSDVLNTKAIKIAVKGGINVQIKYWNDFDNRGTTVTCSDGTNDNDKSSVKGFSVIHNISLINIEGAGLSGHIGFSSLLFETMKNSEISVVLYSQASSEYSISLAVYTNQVEKAVISIKEAFKDELEKGIISKIESYDDLAIIAAVGDKMAGTKGVAGTFFRSLGKASINVKAIAQGSSERNLSAVINGNDSRAALRALHAAFFLSKQALSVGLIGPGNIGGALLDQIKTEKERLKNNFDLDIRIRAIASSTKMLLSDEGIDLENWMEEFEKNAVVCDLDVFANHVSATYFPHRAIIDCTSSNFVASKYISWMENGAHIITPNKKAGTASYEEYTKLFDTCSKTGKRFFYETTVGAGLPIIGTLKDLVQTGDTVKTIEGIVSGTLAWLFNNYDGTVPFSELVMKAKNMGYTEPDPRDDLSGMDVARKTVILARELGYKVEVSDLSIESLVPEQLSKLPIYEFLSKLNQLDDIMLNKFNDAKKENKRLCYVGKVDENGKCSVSLTGYPLTHPFAQASGTDNVICFTTDRYLTQPLVIKGPGAGREVTAGGVFSDILRLSAFLGARL